MGVELLLQRIDERVAALGQSERKILLRGGLDLATIRRIRGRQQIPGVVILAQLETALECPPGYLIEAAADRQGGEPSAPVALEAVHVRGAIQAGAFHEALEWEPAKWFPIYVPVRKEFAEVPRFGLVVRGDSMDRIYPDGTVVVVVRFADLARGPRSGERVVVLRRSPTADAFEATLKEYELDGRGRHVLWPRSTDPAHQAPIVLAGATLPITDGEAGLPPTVFATPIDHDAGEPDLQVSALVIGSYRPEPSPA